MKTLGLLAAAAAAMLMAPAAASAAPVSAPAIPAVSATAITASATALTSAQDRRYHDRRDRRWRGHGRRAQWRTVCTRKWRHGRSVRVCRKVRGWR